MARRYTQEQRDEALGALMASATLDEGVWQPQYRPVESVTNISRTTLMRFWRERDVTQDVTLRASVARGRDECNDAGASDWMTDQYKLVKCKVNGLLSRKWTRAFVVSDGAGGTEVATEDLEADKAARAIHLTIESLGKLNTALGKTEPKSADTDDTRAQRLAARVKAAGLVGDDDS